MGRARSPACAWEGAQQRGAGARAQRRKPLSPIPPAAEAAVDTFFGWKLTDRKKGPVYAAMRGLMGVSEAGKGWFDSCAQPRLMAVLQPRWAARQQARAAAAAAQQQGQA